MPSHEMTPEERITRLERQVQDLAYFIGQDVIGDTFLEWIDDGVDDEGDRVTYWETRDV